MRGHLPRGHGAKGQQHVCDDPTNASALRPGAAKRRGRWIAALLFKVNDLLDFNPGLSGAPGKLWPGMIQMCRGRGCAVAGLGPWCPQAAAGTERSQPCVAPGLGNEIFVCRSSWSERPVSSLLQMLPDNDMHGSLQCCFSPFFNFFFFSSPAGRFSWPVCAGEMLICGLLDRALRPFLLQLFLPHSQLLRILPAFFLGCASYSRAVPEVLWCSLCCPSPPVLSQHLVPPCFGQQHPLAMAGLRALKFGAAPGREGSPLLSGSQGL